MTKLQKKQETIKDKKGRAISICSWLPPKTICQLVLVHGFSEHIEYYQQMAKTLCDQGFAIHMMDLPGHGMSGGIRGHIGRFSEYTENVELLLTANPFYLKTKPTFLLGHSLGGLISCHYCLEKVHPFKGLILSSPLTGFSAGSFPTYLLFRMLAKNHGNEPFPKPAGVKSLSRNPKKWRLYQSDPCRGRLITPNLYLTLFDSTKKLQMEAAGLTLPLLMFISAKDSVVCPEASQAFYRSVNSKDKSLIVFAEAMHELFQERESAQVIGKMKSWMMDRI